MACITAVIIDAITMLQMVKTISGGFADVVEMLVHRNDRNVNVCRDIGRISR